MWFGDERRYYTTAVLAISVAACCGLVMKEDITQHPDIDGYERWGCGLVMKEDITQRACVWTFARYVLWFGDERRYYTTLNYIKFVT